MTRSFFCPHCGAENGALELDADKGIYCVVCGRDIAIAGERLSRTGDSGMGAMGIFSVLVVVLACLWGAFWLLVPDGGSHSSPRREQCARNLKTVALAMHHYCERNGCLPPAYVADKNGRPIHSWRALLLPYMEGEAKRLGDRYNFDEPWDSPGNRKVTDVALSVYRCPSGPKAGKPTTSYMMVVGPHTISDGPHARKPTEITDGFSKTIFLVEVADSDVSWAEPKDLKFDELDFKIAGIEKKGIGSYHSCGAYVATGDGVVRFFTDASNPELLKAMLTVDGGEKIPGDDAY